MSLATIKFEKGPDRRRFNSTVPDLDQRRDAAVHAFRHRRHPQPRTGPADSGRPARRAAARRRASARHRLGRHAPGPVAAGRRHDRRLRHREAVVRIQSRIRPIRCEVPLPSSPRERTNCISIAHSEEALDLKELKNLKLAVGQQLVVTVIAEDNCTLRQDPNIAPGEKYQLSVVSPEQLLSILEARELTCRMRLESIVQDVTTSRDRLARLDLTPAKASSPHGGKRSRSPLC